MVQRTGLDRGIHLDLKADGESSQHSLASWAERRQWGKWGGTAAQAVVLGCALAAVLGLIPWQLSPQGTVLRIYQPEVEDIKQMVEQARGQPRAQHLHRLHADERVYVDYLRRDLARGRLRVRLPSRQAP